MPGRILCLGKQRGHVQTTQAQAYASGTGVYILRAWNVRSTGRTTSTRTQGNIFTDASYSFICPIGHSTWYKIVVFPERQWGFPICLIRTVTTDQGIKHFFKNLISQEACHYRFIVNVEDIIDPPERRVG